MSISHRTRRTGGAITGALVGSLAGVALLPLPLMAQDFGAGPRFSGDVEAEYLQNGDSADPTLYGRFDLGFGAGAFGFELGIDVATELGDGSIDKALTGGVTLSTAFGDLTAGAPRSAGEMLLKVPSFAGMRGLDRSFALQGAPTVTARALEDGSQSYGVQLMAGTGGLRYGASLHRYTGDDRTLIQGAGAYQLGSGEVQGVIEADLASGEIGATLGGAFSFGSFDASAYVMRQMIDADGTAVQATLGYRLSDSLSVDGSLRHANFGTSENMFGASATYSFGNGAYARFGAADGNTLPTMLDASLGFKF